MSNTYFTAIDQACQDGNLNKYMADKLKVAVDNGMTKSLVQELLEDAQAASDAGVKDDRGYTVYFFANRFADDILDDTFGMKLDPNKKKDLCHYIVAHSDHPEYKMDNLVDFRLLVHKWLCDGLSKRAYPNIAGKEDRDTIYDVDRWIGTLKDIYASLHAKEMNRRQAIEHFTADWDSDERRKFENWMRYYESGTTEKYNVKTATFIKEAFGPDLSIPESWMHREDRASDGASFSTVKDKKEETKREKELTKAKTYKTQMRSRLRAFKRLLEKYHDLLPKQDLDGVYDEVYKLEKSIGRLDVYASLQDCVIRSANKMTKLGFSEGAEFLHKIAAEPVAGQDVLQSMPAGASKDPVAPPDTGNLANIQTVISRLEALSKALKSRDMIRELASIDILLNEMGMASYFPELTDAQAKMIESFGYASNKIESIVAKLRGSGASKPGPEAPPAPVPAPTQAPPAKPIDTGELMAKPVGEAEEKLPTG